MFNFPVVLLSPHRWLFFRCVYRVRESFYDHSNTKQTHHFSKIAFFTKIVGMDAKISTKATVVFCFGVYICFQSKLKHVLVQIPCCFFLLLVELLKNSAHLLLEFQNPCGPQFKLFANPSLKNNNAWIKCIKNVPSYQTHLYFQEAITQNYKEKKIIIIPTLS